VLTFTVGGGGIVQTCAQQSPAGWLPFLGLLGALRWRRRR
jgi:uncharacterized protein (TIGR03382 family)